MSPRSWHTPLEFGDGEAQVRLFEDSNPEDLAGQIVRILSRKVDEDAIYLAAGRAAARSTRYDGLGSGRVPLGLFCLRAHRDLGSRLSVDLRHYPLVAVARRIHAEIRDPLFGPTRLLHFEPFGVGSREEIRDAYLEALLIGETDLADHLFAWLFENLTMEEISDLLWTGGIEKVGLGSFKLTGAVEVFRLLQALEWVHGALLLRASVRHQSHRLVGENPFPACRDRVVRDGLHQKARRRLPGERGRGEDDPGGIWESALAWAGAAPEARTTLAARALAGEWTLEDYWEAVVLGTTILFLGASASGGSVSRAVRMVLAVHGLRAMLRHGNLGQKVLASLLVGRTPEFLATGEGWLDAGVRMLEAGLRASMVSTDQLGEALAGWEAEAVLGCIASASADAERVAEMVPLIDQRLAFLHGLEAMGPLFHLAQCDWFEAGRSPHRWIHVAASGWLCAVWPGRGLLEEKELAELADRRRKRLSRGRQGR